MRTLLVIIGIFILLSGTGLHIFGKTAEQDYAEGLVLLERTISAAGMKEVECGAFYRAAMKDNSTGIEDISQVFRDTGFYIKNIYREEDVITIKGRHYSGTEGILFLYRSNASEYFTELKIYHSETDLLYDIMQKFSKAISPLSDGGINTWILKGAIEKTLTPEEILNLKDNITTGMECKVAEEEVRADMASMLGYSPHLLPGVKIAGKDINFNFVIKVDGYENKTFLYAGVPFLSIPY